MTCEEILKDRMKKAFNNGFFPEITQPEDALSFVIHHAKCAASLEGKSNTT